MDTPVCTKYHKEHMTYEEFVTAVHTEVDNHCSEYTEASRNKHWNSEEWQTILPEEYARYSESCQNETDWDLAVNAVMCEFGLIF